MFSLNDKADLESKAIWYKTKEYSYSSARVWNMESSKYIAGIRYHSP